MHNWLIATALRLARVSSEPKPPIGAPGSIRIFRAGKNYYYLRLLRWGITQIGASIGLVFSIGFMTALTVGIDAARTALNARPTATASPAPSPGSTRQGTAEADRPAAAAVVGATPNAPSSASASPLPSPAASPSPSSSPRRNRQGVSAGEILRRMTSRMPQPVLWFFTYWFVPILIFLEVMGIVTFLVSLPFTYALARVEFEQHWYIVTDRSLRIRTGVLSLSESTMSFANLQQVEVKQGPIQGFLGLADVRVRSAGGGEGGEHEGETMHMGVFRSVENADEIRDLILARLRAFREAGLGDPDPTTPARSEVTTGVSAGTIAAAREVLDRARDLRLAMGPSASSS